MNYSILKVVGIFRNKTPMAQLYPFIRKLLLILLILFYSDNKKIAACISLDTLKIQDGDHIYIYSYPGITASIKSEFIMSSVKSINRLTNSAAFLEVLIQSIISSNTYTISNTIARDPFGRTGHVNSFHGYPKGGGYINAGTSVEPRDLAHEFFHIFQYEKRGMLPPCVCYEVDAYLFQDLVLLEAYLPFSHIISENEYHMKYVEALDYLVIRGYSINMYKQAIAFFKHSTSNDKEIYSKFPLCTDKYLDMPLIAKFLTVKS